MLLKKNGCTEAQRILPFILSLLLTLRSYTVEAFVNCLHGTQIVRNFVANSPTQQFNNVAIDDTFTVQLTPSYQLFSSVWKLAHR